MPRALRLKRPGPEGLALALGYLGSSGALMVGSAAQLVTFALLARGLGVEQFGLLIAVTVATNIAAQFCGLGAHESLLRRVAAEPALYPTALGHTLLLLAGSGAGLSLVLMLLLPHLVRLSPDANLNLAALLALVLANVVLARLILLTEQIFIARWRMGWANFVNLGFALGRTLAAGLACLVFGVATAAHWAFWSLGAHALIAAACLLAIRRFGRPRLAIMREEVRLGLYFSTPFVFRAFRQNADTLVLGAVAPPETVGAFNMARRIVETSFLSVEALHRLIYPRLARLAPQGLRRMLPLAARAGAAAVALSLATALGLTLVAPLMPWLFGQGFSAMVGDLRAMAFVVVLVTLHDVPAEVLGASARHGLRAGLYNAGNALGAGLSALLTYLYLLPGTYLAFYLTEAALVVAFWWVLARLVRASDAAPAGRPSPDRTALPLR